MSKGYWLEDWIDQQGVSSKSRAERLLRDPVIRRDLLERAISATPEAKTPDAENQMTIVAGRAIDLSGELDCSDPKCIRKEVDLLFSKVLHYFDKVIVAGPNPRAFASLLDSPNLNGDSYVIGHILNFLYLREIGARDFLIFRSKPDLCEEHTRETLQTAGIPNIFLETKRLIRKISKEADFGIEKVGSMVAILFDHPLFDHPLVSLRDHKAIRVSRNPKYQATAELVWLHLAALASDITAGRIWGAPLGSTLRFHRLLIEPIVGKNQTEEIAFHLELPILRGLDAKTLVRLRRDEQPHFEKFRAALRKAINDRTKVSPGSRSEAIAEEIRNDVIEPSLATLRTRLKAARAALVKKSAVDLSLAALPVVFGLYAGNPILAAFSALASPYAIKHLTEASSKYIDERKEITMSDTYFLFQAAARRRKTAT
jgi:hypothetical protein